MDLKTLKYLCSHSGNGMLPVLAYLHVYDDEAGQRRAQVGNGRYSVDVPTTLPVCTVNADKLAAAWGVCDGEPTFGLTDASLMVRGGARRSRVGLSDPTAYPRTAPTPKTSHTAPGVSAMLKNLKPFVATDASRVWATGVCLNNGFAYATNNVILCRVAFPTVLPETVIVPSACFDAVIDRGEPVDMGVEENSVTFYYEDSTWIRTNLIAAQWPTHVVDGFIEKLPDEWATPHERMGPVLNAAVKLADMRIPVVEFFGTGLRLIDGTFEADNLEPVPEKGKLNARMAALVFEHATAIQWHQPREDAHAFKAGDIIGLFGGQR